MSILAERIGLRLVALGMSQVQLAKDAGYEQQGINSIMAGKVERPRKLREIARVLQTSQEYLLGESDDPVPTEPPKDITYVPVFNGSVSAGRLADTGNDLPPTDRFVPVNDLGGGDFVAIPVKGDSMDRISPDGSIIIVNRHEQTPHAGKPYVFAIRGEMTYKLWEPKPPRLEPFSWNPSNRPIFVDKQVKLIVIGRVRRTILDL